MTTDPKIKRKRWKINGMTQEELECNWAEAERQLANMTEEEGNKFVDRMPSYLTKAVSKVQGQEKACPSCPHQDCGKKYCQLDENRAPVDVLMRWCDEMGCPGRCIEGVCPLVCTRYIIQREYIFTENVVKFGLIEWLVAEGRDLKTWRPEGDKEYEQYMEGSE